MLGSDPLIRDWVSLKNCCVRWAVADALRNRHDPETLPFQVLMLCVAL